MTGLVFLLDWALRGAVLAFIGEASIRLLRIQDVSTRLAISVGILVSTLTMPLLGLFVPSLFRAVATAKGSAAVAADTPVASSSLVFVIYCTVAVVLLLRTAVGLYLADRIRRQARPLDFGPALESGSVTVPVSVGLVHPAILLPESWHKWSDATLDAVLAHEQSHIRRHDTRVQFLSAIHRALLWFSPVSWWLDGRIARLAEDASDDRALSVTDRISYAETLLHFVQVTPRRVLWTGVSMARTLKAEQRIDRILSGHVPSTGLRPAVLAAIILTTAPITYLMAAARQEAPPPPPPPPVAAPAAPAPPPPRPSPARRAAFAGQAPIAPAPPPPPPELLEVEVNLAEAVANGILGGVEGGVQGGVVAGVPGRRPLRTGESGPIDTAIRRLEQQVDQLNQMIETLRWQQEMANRSEDRLPGPASPRKRDLPRDRDRPSADERPPIPQP